MTGMDMLIQNLLKASGIDPAKVKEDIAGYGKKLAEKIDSMDQAMQSIRNDQTSLRESVEFIRSGQVTISELLLEISRVTTARPAHPNGDYKP